MKLELTGKEKPAVFSEAEKFLHDLGLKIVATDASRPWGGFFVIDEKQVHDFGKLFFPGENLSDFSGSKLSPKILLVQPNTRLSWQYHHRRAEIWAVVSGKVGVITSDDDKEGSLTELNSGDNIRLAQGRRHRLVGLEGWGIIAEIWQHTNPANPSNEEDIVRVQDDFGR